MELEKWFCRELAKLGVPANEDNARFLLSMENVMDLEEYLHGLLDGTDSKVQGFLQELRNRCGTVKVRQIKKDLGPPLAVKQKRSKNESIKKSSNIESLVNKQMTSTSEDSRTDGEIGIGAKKKSKFVPLYSKEGQTKSVIQIPGRHVCDCMAAKHNLINNCLNCGRIVCEQEGAGPCIFCENLVCTSEEQEILARGSKKSEKLRNQLMKEGKAKVGLGELRHPLIAGGKRAGTCCEEALKHRDRLLEYDQTSARRTQVIDDECDYFATDSNRWLSNTDREKLRKREEELRNLRHRSKRSRKIIIDFAGRCAIDESEGSFQRMYDKDDAVIQDMLCGKGSLIQADMLNPPIYLQTLEYLESETVSLDPKKKEWNCHTSSNRIQDRELQEMSDEGMCMSMHQPWASLLVYGIKMHEGRIWYTAHRGRLWIAATAKTPSSNDIQELEDMYQKIYPGQDFKFPSSYPVGCLLGCVNVDDCLDQYSYREKFPDGESGSPYVFICSSPCQLVVKLPIKGKHKIYKLEAHVHQAAKKGLK